MKPARSYWRSLAQLADDPRARSFMEREFPEHASELPEGVSRRTMLSLLGATLSLAGLAGCRRPVERIVPYVNAPEEILPGVPLRFATTMPLGLAAYGLIVESHEGRPTKVEGNPLHPSTTGASSVWMQSSILDLYDPDRSQSALSAGQRSGWPDFVAAWGQLAATHAARGGSGLAVLTESFASPTLARLAELFRGRYPASRFVVYEPISDQNIHDGVQRATGSPLQPVYHLDRARVILALDADFLGTETDGVRLSREFADGRRVVERGDTMSRLYAAEGVLSLTGANADHRLVVESGQIGALLARLAAELDAGPAAPDPPGVDPAWIRAVVSDLAAHRGQGIVLAGRRQPASVHAAVLALNAVLGNIGQTVTLHEPVDQGRSDRAALRGLVEAMARGEVETLVMLGGNPVYNAPADLDFAGALEKVRQSMHLSLYVDETSRKSGWHLPRTHFLESWGDARAIDGTLSVIQPLIAPLFGGHSDIELLGLLATGEDQTGYDRVRESWNAVLGGSSFEPAWRRVLHDGLLAGSALPPVEPRVRDGLATEIAGMASTLPARPEELEVVFECSPSVFDGRWANNGWLQELPEPLTKLTWDNAGLISPGTAQSLALANGDRVLLHYGGRSLELPIWIVPGQVDRSVSVHLGYGREAAGRVGDHRGANAYRLRGVGTDFDRGATLEKTGGTYMLAETQDHGTMDELGEQEMAKRVPFLVREATLEEFSHDPHFAEEMIEHPPLESLWKEHSYDDGLQWGMTIDLNACTGCNACVVACQSENNVPIVGREQVIKGREMHWIRVDRYFNGDVDRPETVFQPVPCMQCENAPCEQVCPVAATVHDAEGLNAMVYNRCIGTRYCSNNCPYKVRRFNFYNFTKDTPELLKLANNPEVTVRSRGVMEKCTYCTQRIQRGKLDAKLAGREYADGDVLTACEQACPTRAITFGNIRDPESRVSRSKRQERNYVLLAELNNKPRTSYLAKLRNPHPDLARAPEA